MVGEREQRGRKEEGDREEEREGDRESGGEGREGRPSRSAGLMLDETWRAHTDRRVLKGSGSGR